MSDEKKVKTAVEMLVWSLFAAAGLTGRTGKMESEADAAKQADVMLEEFNQRFNLAALFKKIP